jgi:hypothetical protein
MTVLSNAAPGFFAIVRDVIRDDAFISLSRLTDQPRISGKENLSMITLVELAKDSGNLSLSSAAQLLLSQLLEHVDDIREWRNKWLAHTDLSQALLERPLPNTQVQRGEIDEALRLIRELMNLFVDHLSQERVIYELPIVPGDADVLARLLESLYEMD